ncbi:ImmA/IrrE family metallo-endopeptidase [Corynebacterium phoceense]|uniref:ImmA/IrrE family metallo-endopeptidase n=1 Tax=Corynebacterium phoceense TaxID=1686286 RepID=UPI00211CF49F|nr:ImmA/IrrE family metallo-endopeptidase [Corynebacterium phoceense]
MNLTHHDGGRKGYWHPASRTISTRRGLTIAEYKSTLTHEIAHAFHGDHYCHGHYKQRQERRADKWAANLLLSPRDVEEALIFNPYPAVAAYDLEVTQHLLETWLRTNHEKITTQPH